MKYKNVNNWLETQTEIIKSKSQPKQPLTHLSKQPEMWWLFKPVATLFQNTTDSEM